MNDLTASPVEIWCAIGIIVVAWMYVAIRYLKEVKGIDKLMLLWDEFNFVVMLCLLIIIEYIMNILMTGGILNCLVILIIPTTYLFLGYLGWGDYKNRGDLNDR